MSLVQNVLFFFLFLKHKFPDRQVFVSFCLQEWYEEYSRTNLQPDETFHRELDSPEVNASNSIN